MREYKSTLNDRQRQELAERARKEFWARKQKEAESA